MKLWRLGVLLLVIVLNLIPLSPVLSVPADPDDILIGSLGIFRNVLETGDQLWFVRYDVNYGSVPTEPASNLFSMAIYDDTLAFTGYIRPIEYYQHNIISIYLTPDQALDWGDSYRVRIMGNPLVFTLTEGVNMITLTASGGNYREADELEAYLRGQAEILEVDWSLTLLTTEGRLNTTGAFYFNKAIPGLTSMIPSFFQVAVSSPSLPDGVWTTEREDEWRDQRGPDLTATVEWFQDFTGAGEESIGILFVAVIGALLAASAYGATRRPDLALVLSFVAVPLGAWVGLIDITLWMVIGVILAIGFGIVFIMGRIG